MKVELEVPYQMEDGPPEDGDYVILAHQVSVRDSKMFLVLDIHPRKEIEGEIQSGSVL